ncbi:MAG: S46 family peptidase [Bacteroidetes bacterium]|nr:S46 family peptidase [Bacteroidota bacterium]
MKFFQIAISAILLVIGSFFYGCSSGQVFKDKLYGYINFDTVQAGQYDTGKMWTFDFPPIEYFEKTYGFSPSKEWLEKARLSALRLPNCTASFVSEDGLIMTNHHCARAALDSVNRAGENLIEAGFYASTLEEERKSNGIYVDQLIVMEDVTVEVQQAFESGSIENEKISKRLKKIQEIQDRYAEKYKAAAPQDSTVFRVISFYNGGKFSLYGHKRYTDIRLVYAPEESMAYFGGNADNFTYPRYDFDCAFFRVYENNKPLKTDHFFRLSQNGAGEGDAVFVIGNPGTTHRLKTVAQLESLRDFDYPKRIEILQRMSEIFSAHITKHPEKRIEHLNTVFSIENSLKAINGYLEGLRNPLLMARKIDFEKKFKEELSKKPDLKKQYKNLWNDIAGYQSELQAVVPELNALKMQGRHFSRYFSLTSDLIDTLKFSPGTISESARDKFCSAEFDHELEKQLLALGLKTMKDELQGKNEAFEKLMSGRIPELAAEQLSRESFLASKEKAESLLAEPPDSILAKPDPIMSFILKTRGHVKELQRKYSDIYEKLQASVQALGKAMFEVYGTQFPPDATFSLRISDGKVKTYEYNGTVAPPVTTIYGLYDRYYSFGRQYPWNLTERWMYPPSSFKMSTPINFISTNDIIGGNSGSPVINKNLEVVGLVFDGNIESLPGSFIFDETKNRAVSVHSAGILEVLEQIYQAKRIVNELRSGKITQ